MENKQCWCGNWFRPFHGLQQRCVCCLVNNPPREPSDDTTHVTREFAEWFIYHWHTIRKSAGVEVDDGIICGGDAEDKKSLRQMCRERGVEVSTVSKRMSRGWTLEEALCGKRGENNETQT